MRWRGLLRIQISKFKTVLQQQDSKKNPWLIWGLCMCQHQLLINIRAHYFVCFVSVQVRSHISHILCAENTFPHWQQWHSSPGSCHRNEMSHTIKRGLLTADSRSKVCGLINAARRDQPSYITVKCNQCTAFLKTSPNGSMVDAFNTVKAP